MTTAIMQPYFFPYIGYFQLVDIVDKFVVYDNIEFSKRSWVNRNRYLSDGSDKMFTLPLEKSSDYLNINQKQLAPSFQSEKEKIKRRIEAAYKSAPHFSTVFPLFVECLDYPDYNLFNFVFNSISKVKTYLSIESELVISSSIEEPNELRGQDRVLAICQKLNTDHYINAIGGMELYDKDTFKAEGIKLSFLKTAPIVYEQTGNDFIPNLSILDVMMFNSQERVRGLLHDYELI